MISLCLTAVDYYMGYRMCMHHNKWTYKQVAQMRIIVSH